MQALYERMHWLDDLSFQFRGIYRERGNSRILFFSLDEPRIHLSKAKQLEKMKEKENNTAFDVPTENTEQPTETSETIQSEEITDTDDEPIQYIKYKKDDADECNVEFSLMAYPNEWQTNIGLSHAMRKRRDWLTESVTEADIMVEGTCAVNPLIGKIPTKEQALNELESLLIEM